MSSQLHTVRLCRGDATPWGFRLQGGADFGTPLTVQKVNEGSLAHQAGLYPGDAVIKINDVDVFTLRHKDAQDIVVRSGNNFSMTIQRGGSLWRPHVTPTGQLPAHQSHLGNNVQTVTRTSLAHKHPQPVEHIGCGYNNAARPFSAVNGSDGQLKSIVNKQYNTPVGIYSEESIAETLTAQAEVLAGGVLGVNFKKHEKEYNPTNSEVLKFLNEEQSEPREPAHYNNYASEHHHQQQQQHHHHQSSDHQHQQQQQHHQQSGGPVRHVTAPVGQPKVQNTGGLPSGQNICAECERLIVGVFCRIKDKNLHVECFKCATCGTSLKNQGYYNFNNKLYCDIHAKAAAMKNPPPGTEGYVPIPLKPTPKLTAGHIANALNAHGYNLQTNGATPALVTGSAPPAGGNVSQGYAPRPFNQGQLSPPSGSQRSPGSGAPSWSQPRPAPIVAQSPYATLPRTGSSQGRHSYSSHSSSNAYSANKSHVTFGPNTYSRPVPIQSAYNNVNIYNRGEGQTQNEIQIQEEPQPKVKHPDHFEDLEVETLNQPPVSTRPFTWPPKESETQDMAPTATPIYIPPPGTQHVLVKEHQEDVMRKQEEEIQRQQIVKEEHRQVQRQEQQQKTVQTQQKTQEYYEQQQLSQQESRQQQQQEQQQWQVRSAPQLNSHYHVEVESGSDSYTSTSTTTTTTSEEYNRMYQAQLQAYQMQQMYDQSGSEYDYHMEIDQHNVRQEQDHCYSMSSDIHSIQSGRRSVQECADNLQSTLSMYKLIDMVREVTPSPTPMNKPRRVEFLDSEETLEQKSKKEETLTVNETAQQTTEKNVTEEKEQSKPGEEERRQSVVEEIIVPQKVSSVGSSEDTGRRIIITPIEESTERLFPPTPEIKVIFPPPLILPPSNIPNPVPKEWINPMVKALTIAPDKPIELHPGLDEYLSDIQEEQSAADLTAETEQTTSSTQPAEYYCSTVECKSSSKIPGDTSKLTCIESCQNVCSGTCSERAAEAPCTTCPMSKGNICCKKNQSQNETIQQSILKEEPPKGSKISKTLTSVPEYKFQFAPAAGEYIPLPEETKPYMPPPIDMTPYTKEDFRPKSPMLSALITAPDEPYKRFESDVCSQLLDMPTVSEKLTLSDALITAPERAYSPLSTDNILKLGLDQPPTKPEYIHLSLEEQKAETEQKVFEKRQESMDRKISAFVSLGDYDSKKQSFQNQSDSNEKESKLTKSNLESQFLCGTPRNSLEFPELCELQPPSYFEQKYQHTLLQQSMTEQSTRKQSINQSETHHHLQSNTETGIPTERRSSQDGSNMTELKKQSVSDATKVSEHDAQVASLPPINSKNAKRSLLSGLHKPDNIPQYQRNWTVLPSQRPVRTPEPEDLKHNVPLAFVPMPDRSPSPNPDIKPKQPQMHRTLRSVSPASMPSSNHHLNVPSSTKTPNAIGEAASSRSVNINGNSTTNITTSSTTTPNVPLIIENRVGPITMTFQSLDDIPDDHSVRSGAYTPSFTNKPAPIIPYYQTPEKLVFEECSSVEARPYDRRSASPFPDRTHSPAPGPPPNPLKTIAIHAPRIKENTLNVVPRSPMGGSITTGQSYLGTQMAQQQQEQILSHYQTGMDSGSRSLIDKPEIIQERQIGDLHVQTKQKESHLQEEKKSEQETQTKSQIGNMQIERRRKVVEEYEHSQSAKTVEIRTQSQGEKKNQYGKTGFVANQARRLSGLEEEISSLTSQSQAISARAANLGVRSETRFPETKSPTPSNAFPIKPVLPPHDQPKMPTYIVPSPSDNKLAGAPPGFVHRYDQFNQQIPDATQSKSTACAASSISKRSQSLTTSSLTFGQKSKLMTSDIPTLTPTAPQHYVGGPLTSNLSTSSIASNSNTITSSLTNTTTSRDTQEQNISKFTSSTNTYRPTASTGPAGFKPPPPGAIQVLPHPLPTPSSGVTTPKQQSSASHDTRQVIFPPTPEQLIQDDLFKTKQTATAAAATANSTFNTTSMQSAIASSASFASNQTTSSINSTTNIDTKSAADTGVGGKSGGSFSATSAPKRGRGILNKAVGPGSRIPQCGACQTHISKIDVTNTCDSPPLPPPPPPEFLEQSLIEGLQDISTLPAPPTPPPSEIIPSIIDKELKTISQSDDSNSIENIESTLEKSLISIMNPDKDLNLNNSVITRENTPKGSNYSTSIGATEMLTDSLDKISVEDKNNFMSEAGKIISNMLEARLTQNNNNKNLESTSPRNTLIKTKSSPKQNNNDNVFDNENSNTKKLLNSHPMKNILDICDSKGSSDAINNNPVKNRNIIESGQYNKQTKPNDKISISEDLSKATTVKDDLSVLGEKVTKSPFLARKTFNNDIKSGPSSFQPTPNNIRNQITNTALQETSTSKPNTLKSDTVHDDDNREILRPLESATAVIHRENKKCNRNDSRRLSTQAFDRRSYIEKDNQLMNAINEAVAVASSFQQQLDEHQQNKKNIDSSKKNNDENSLKNLKSSMKSENFVNNMLSSPSSSVSNSIATPENVPNKITDNDLNGASGNKLNGSNNDNTAINKSKKSDVNGGNDSIESNENKIDTKGLKVYDGKEPIICCDCNKEIKRGPFITALGRIWCPDHFMCVNGSCRRPLQDIGFVEEKGDLYCEFCFEKYLAPTCSKCNGKIKGDCLNAIGKHFHPECFTCAYCGKLFGNTPFFLEDGEPYCEADWNELFTTKCFACGFPVEAGDRWVEALNHNYHSQCFNCTMCKKNLEGQSFFNKGGRPFCKNHAR